MEKTTLYLKPTFDGYPWADFKNHSLIRLKSPDYTQAAQKLHWPLQDPASQTASDDEQLIAFRQTRDEIRKRIQILVLQKFPAT